MLFIHVHAFSWTCGCILLGIQLGVEMLGHRICMFDFSWYYQYSEGLCQTALLPAVCETCSCSTTLSTLGIVSLKILSHSGVCAVVVYCGFNLCYSDRKKVEHLLLCFGAILISSLVRCLFKFHVHFSNELSVLLYSGYNPFVSYRWS